MSNRTPEQQAAVEEASNDLLEAMATPAGDKRGLNDLIERYAELRREREEATALEKVRREVEDDAERELFDEMERLGLRSARHERYGLFILDDKAWPKITDSLAARGWAESEAPDLITLNSTRLGPYVREALKEGRELPPGVDFTLSRKIQWRRS